MRLFHRLGYLSGDRCWARPLAECAATGVVNGCRLSGKNNDAAEESAVLRKFDR